MRSRKQQNRALGLQIICTRDLAKVQNFTWGQQVIAGLQETYCSAGWGVELVFEDHIFRLRKPVEQDEKWKRRQLMQANLNTALVQLEAIWDLELLRFVTDTQVAGTIAMTTDEEFAGKWEALLMKYTKAEEPERMSILAQNGLDLNDSSIGGSASAGRRGHRSKIHKRPLCEGWETTNTAIDLSQ